MRLFSRIGSLFALWLFHAEWLELSRRLRTIWETQRHLVHPPTTLAQELLISGEDHRFFRHGGVDPIAICRAVWRRIAFGRSEGGSTIEMQVVRVVSGRFERTLRRKLCEMALATLVARAIPKEDLPELYLRIGYFGWRMNGFAEACHRLGVAADSLTPADTARLVARLKYPQPRIAGQERWSRINIRAQHLLWLHSQHKGSRAYVGLKIAPAYEAI